MISKFEEKPTPAQVDALIRRYAEAQSEVKGQADEMKAASERLDAIKGELVELVQRFGSRHTEKSTRIQGNHSSAMVTVGTRVSIDADAVEDFRLYLQEKNLDGVAPRFFTERVTYQLVDGPREVLKTLDLGARIRTKISGLLGRCFQVKTNAPSLKVDFVA